MGSMPRILGVLAAVLLAAQAAAEEEGGSPVDRALSLVMACHPELKARKAEYRAVADAPSWSAEVDLSLSRGQSDFGASDTSRASVTVSIPLVGAERDSEVAAANRARAGARDEVRQAFLEGVSELRGLAVEVERMAERRTLLEDRLAYQREAVEAGEAEPEALWAEVEQLQEAEHDYRRAAAELDAQVEALARRFGGQAWKRLRDLLAEIVS